MSKYSELATDLRNIVERRDQMARESDPTHALEQVGILSELLRGHLWITFQLLKELARLNAEPFEVKGPD